MKLEDIRREYLAGGLHRESLSEDPFEQFKQWLDQAVASGMADPTAMTVATVSPEGQPSQRIVLLKHFDSEGFVFYTNFGSRKAEDIAHNPRVSLHFPWHSMERQVKIEGLAMRVPVAESLQYFLSRPRDSQLAAWASQQSRKISSRQALLMQYERMKEKFAAGQVPLPDFWGGYRVVPSVFEFWQGGGSRLHDRFEYRFSTASSSWEANRLAP
jgi:Pyridoxamine 5''-phosphate oxidase (EC 1.4.3.5)